MENGRIIIIAITKWIVVCSKNNDRENPLDSRNIKFGMSIKHSTQINSYP